MHDFVIAGSGIVGLAIAREILQREPHAKILVLEKEGSAGYHASGRNSGVMHAGFYYSPDSLKAKFTRQGNEFWRNFAREKRIPILECGKLVVPTNEEELNGLQELYRRGQINGVKLEMIDAQQANEIEPRANVFEKAIWSPTTAVIDIRAALNKILEDLVARGCKVKFSTAVQKLERQKLGKHVLVTTDRGTFRTKHFINSAGLYADKLARDLGFSREYRIIPFKGLYLYGDESQKLRTHIYPVPDIKFPFLGVHFTVTVDGHVKMGPTAIPAFWRENYQGLERFSGSEMLQILADEAFLFATNKFNFRNLALKEIPKFFKSRMAADGNRLLKDVKAEDFPKWGKPGIRAQLLNTETWKLEMDFVVQGDEYSTHVLNSVSPAFTCAIPFAAHVVDQMFAKLLKSRGRSVTSTQLERRDREILV